MENNQDNNNQNINNNQPKKKKGHGPLYWIIVVIGITFIMYMSILIGERLGKTVSPDVSTNNNQAESNSNVDSNITSNVQENKETKLTDKVKINYLKKYVAILENLKVNADYTKISPKAGISYFMHSELYALDKLEKKDITVDSATTAIAASSPLKRDYFANQPLTPSTLKKFGNSVDEYEYISVADFMDDYKTLFGFDKISTKNITFRCEDYIYDNKINAFVMFANGCGVASPIAFQKTYIYDITEDNNNVYVYIAYGVTGQNEKNQFIAYTDYNMNKKYEGKVTKDFTVNESNYKDFSKYKYTFTKNNDGTYTFSEFNLLK